MQSGRHFRATARGGRIARLGAEAENLAGLNMDIKRAEQKGFLLCYVLALALVALPVAAQEMGRGPLGLTNQYPLALLHANIVPDSSKVIDGGRLEFGAIEGVANTNAQRDGYQVDAESWNTFTQAKVGLGGGVELVGRLPLLWRGAGILDGPIKGWHDLWDLPQGDRDRIDNGEYNIEGERKDWRAFDLNKKGAGLGNAALGLKYQLPFPDEKRIPVALLADFSLPTATSQYGHGSVDSTLGVLAGTYVGDFIFYGGIAEVIYGETETADVLFPRSQQQGFFYTEYRLSSAWSLLAGVYGSNGSIKDVADHPSNWGYLDLSARYQVTQVWGLDFLVREDMAGQRGTTDVAFALGVSYRT